jgi:hypothetical protein
MILIAIVMGGPWIALIWLCKLVAQAIPKLRHSDRPLDLAGPTAENGDHPFVGTPIRVHGHGQQDCHEDSTNPVDPDV